MKNILHPKELFSFETFSHRALFEGVSLPWEVLSLLSSYIESLPLGNIEVTIPEGVTLVNPEQISIGEGTVVEPGAYIKGPCIIGKNCSIRQGAYIRGLVLTGDKCVIGHTTEVKNSLFFDGAQAAHFAYIGDSILGNRVNLGAGTKLANLKLDHSEVFFFFEGEKIATGLKKFGAIIGDRSQIGCNSVTQPGTVMGQDVFCHPLISVGGFIPARSLVRLPVKVEVIENKHVNK